MFSVKLDAFGAPSKDRSGFSMQNVGLLVAALFVAVMPLEISHLLSALVGAAGYLLVQSLHSSVDRVPPKKSKSKAIPATAGQHIGQTSSSNNWRERPKLSSGSFANCAISTAVRSPVGVNRAVSSSGMEVRKPSAVPVVAPTFKSTGWEAEVEELLVRIAPSAESDAVVSKIAQRVKQMVGPIMPEAEVTGFTGGNFLSGTAFGVAVPEVEIVINVSPTALLARLQGRWAQGRNIKPSDLDVRKLQKSAIRACTDRLVGNGAFKFRRSTFRGTEPKVTMLAPAALGICDTGVALNLSVNAETPFYNAAIFTESGQIDPRAQALIVLVKRWAKDRGLCHVAKGHLSPYAWTLLTVYFLQVGVEEESPLLPPLTDFKTCSGLLAAGSTPKKHQAHCSPEAPTRQQVEPATVDSSKSSVGKLFKDFVRFYSARFDWRNEAVSVVDGKRLPANMALPLHIIVHDDGSKTDVAPSIEDPFRSGNNLSEGMGEANLAHLRKEFTRAEQLCAQGASLTAMLEPWAPKEMDAETGVAEVDED